jgi:hypothetical protein
MLVQISVAGRLAKMMYQNQMIVMKYYVVLSLYVGGYVCYFARIDRDRLSCHDVSLRDVLSWWYTTTGRLATWIFVAIVA